MYLERCWRFYSFGRLNPSLHPFIHLIFLFRVAGIMYAYVKNAVKEQQDMTSFLSVNDL